MRVLTNQRVKILFLRMVLCILAFSAVTGLVSFLDLGKGIWLFVFKLKSQGLSHQLLKRQGGDSSCIILFLFINPAGFHIPVHKAEYQS